MRKLPGLLVLGALIALSVTTTAPQAQSAVPVIFETTFNCPDWRQSMGLADANVCAPNDGIAGSGAWTTSAGSQDQITAAANNPLGAGGKGFRHWRGDGVNNVGGGIRIDFPPATQMWFRMYIRYQAGFRWINNHNDSKELFWHEGQSGNYFGHNPNVRFVVHGVEFGSSTNWTTIQNGVVGDGLFHLYEIYAKVDTNGSNGLATIWIDGIQIFNRTNMDWTHGRGTPFSSFIVGENQKNANNGVDMYTDYDDIAISTAGRIGGQVVVLGPRAPMNVRILR